MSDLQRLLKKQKGTSGVSLFEHMCEVIRRLQEEKEKGSKLSEYNNLEVLSDLIKKNQFIYEKREEAEKVNKLAKKREKHTSKLTKEGEKIGKVLSHYLQTQCAPNTQFQGQVQNWPKVSRALEWAGVGFGEQNDCKIQAMLNKLARQNTTYDIQFYGKILCQKKDYWVVSGRLNKYYQESQGDQWEQNGQGINTVTFWAGNNLDKELEELPMITPQQMQVSRQIKRVLTGKLDSEVQGHPCFPGQERHLLKCQLVRITHGCSIAPAGMLKPNEEEGRRIEYSEDYKLGEIQELSGIDNWVHRYPQILRAGKIYHTLDMSLNEEQRVQLLEDQQTADPEVEALRGLQEDTGYNGAESNWVIKQVGDTQLFTKEDGATIQYSSLYLKNLRWPGNITILAGNTFSSIYVGYGYKGDSQPLFFPQEPSDVQLEGNEQEEKPEPNPKNPIQENVENEDEKKEDEEDQ